MSEPHIDLREEPAHRRRERLATTFEGERVHALKDADDGLFREGPWLSENAKRSLQALIGPDWLKYLKLADKLDRGDGDQSNDEQNTLYDGWSPMADMVIDLFNMVSRRDERIVELEAEVQAYVEEAAGPSL